MTSLRFKGVRPVAVGLMLGALAWASVAEASARQRILDHMGPDTAAGTVLLDRCMAELDAYEDGRTMERDRVRALSPGSSIPDDAFNDYAFFAKALGNLLASGDAAAIRAMLAPTEQDLAMNGSVYQATPAGQRILGGGMFYLCVGQVRLAQLGAGPMPGGANRQATRPAAANAAAPAAPAAAQTVAAPPQSDYDQELEPDAPLPLFSSNSDGAAMGALVSVFSGAGQGPTTSRGQRDHAAGQRAYDSSRQRRVHNRLNDATACLKVEPTGVRAEWGVEGRFRILNTCSFPVEASWCANTSECNTGRGNLWTIPAREKWPIFFADANNPTIQIGGCKGGRARQPLPSDAALAAQGGVNEAREQPVPAAGVSLLPSHRCE